MNTPVLTFFNNKGGVGKTSLVYHLSWMLSELGMNVIAVDIDPQSNLTAAFLAEDKLEILWDSEKIGSTIYQAVKPLTGVGDIAQATLYKVNSNLHFIPGDVGLSGFEDALSEQWPSSMGDYNLYRPMRILSSFWQVIQNASLKIGADIILVDIGPNLGAINRSVLIATDYVIIPLGADLFSMQGLRNLGPMLRSWRSLWKKRLDNWYASDESKQYKSFALPPGQMEVIGYVTQQHSVRLDRPVKAYDKWVNRMPNEYRKWVLGKEVAKKILPDSDPFCLATIKHYRSLMPMGQESRKPIFKLTSADGAIGAHASAVQGARKDFVKLAKTIMDKIGLALDE